MVRRWTCSVPAVVVVEVQEEVEEEGGRVLREVEQEEEVEEVPSAPSHTETEGGAKGGRCHQGAPDRAPQEVRR